MSKTAVLTVNAPQPPPGISQAIVAGGFVFCSGSVPIDATTGKIVEGDVQAHTVRQRTSTMISHLTISKHQCIKNLSAVLEAAGTTIDNVVKVNVFLSDMANFAKMNEIYVRYWGDVKPCRT